MINCGGTVLPGFRPLSWPQDIVIASTSETDAEIKATVKQIIALGVNTGDELDHLLEKSSLWQVLRLSAWIARFLFNSRVPREQRRKGALTTMEINEQMQFWKRRAQLRQTGSDNMEEDRLSLNLHPNNNGILECRRRIQGHYPIYLPDGSTYAKKFVEHAHI